MHLHCQPPLEAQQKKAHSQASSALALRHVNKIILIADIHPLSSMKLSHLINLFIPLVLQLYFLITAARTSLQGCLSYYSKWCWIKKKGEYSTALNLRTAVKHLQKCKNGVLRYGFLCIRHSGNGEYASTLNWRAEVRHLQKFEGWCL